MPSLFQGFGGGIGNMKKGDGPGPLLSRGRSYAWCLCRSPGLRAPPCSRVRAALFRVSFSPVQSSGLEHPFSGDRSPRCKGAVPPSGVPPVPSLIPFIDQPVVVLRALPAHSSQKSQFFHISSPFPLLSQEISYSLFFYD